MKEFLDCSDFSLKKLPTFLLKFNILKLKVFPKNFRISSITQLVEYPNFGINAELRSRKFKRLLHRGNFLVKTFLEAKISQDKQEVVLAYFKFNRYCSVITITVNNNLENQK